MRPYLPYNILAALTVLFCGLCALYNFVWQEESDATLRYDYPVVEQAPAEPERAAPERIVPQESEPPPTAQPETLSEVRFPLELNAATEAELKFIPQVGDATAQRIVQYREALGGYRELEQLMEIDGIGQKTFEHLYAYLYIATPDESLG